MRLHRLETETFRFLCHTAWYSFFLFEVKTVILGGLITNACILSTASELYVRDLDVYVPSDCVAAPIKRAHRYALELMKISFDVDTRSSTELNLRKILKAARG